MSQEGKEKSGSNKAGGEDVPASGTGAEGAAEPAPSGTGAEEAPKSGTGGGEGGEAAAGPVGSGTGAPTGSSTGAAPTGSNTGAAPTGSNTGAGPTGSSAGAHASGTKPASGTGAAPPTPTSAGSSRRGKEAAALTNARYGFVGAGKMADAIVKGLIGHTKVESKRIFIASKSGKNHDSFKQRGCHVTKRNYDIFAKMDCDVVFLAFHGWVIRQLYAVGGSRPMSLTTNFIPNQRHPVFILSLVGGIPLGDIKKTLLNPDNPDRYKVEMHRIMLNTSVAYGVGLGAIDIDIDSKKCSPIIRDVLTSFAKMEMVPENKMDVACVVAGNGLTYCYYFIDALAAGGTKIGLAKNAAYKLAAKTLKACSTSLLESGKKAGEMKDACAAPGSPTLFGLHALDKVDCASGISDALETAFKRMKELCEKDINLS